MACIPLELNGVKAILPCATPLWIWQFCFIKQNLFQSFCLRLYGKQIFWGWVIQLLVCCCWYLCFYSFILLCYRLGLSDDICNIFSYHYLDICILAKQTLNVAMLQFVLNWYAFALDNLLMIWPNFPHLVWKDRAEHQKFYFVFWSILHSNSEFVHYWELDLKAHKI